jgi:hypothetical protein
MRMANTVKTPSLLTESSHMYPATDSSATGPSVLKREEKRIAFKLE